MAKFKKFKRAKGTNQLTLSRLKKINITKVIATDFHQVEGGGQFGKKMNLATVIDNIAGTVTTYYNVSFHLNSKIIKSKQFPPDQIAEAIIFYNDTETVEKLSL